MNEKPYTIKSFFDYLESKKLMGVKCLDCGNLMIPPRMICNKCNKQRFEWFQFTGHGTLATFTVLYVPPTFLKEKSPYVLGIVKLDEGPMVTSRIINIEPSDHTNITIDMKLKIEFVNENNRPLLAFRPV